MGRRGTVQGVHATSTDTVAGPDAGPDHEQARAELAERVGQLAQDQGLRVGVAESLTGGMIASALAVASGSGEWFRGSVVAYHADVKHDVLDVPPGPVVSAEAAAAMARGARRLLGADVAVAVTGAGGPDPQDGREPGTVFLAVDSDVAHRSVRLQIRDEEPATVCATTAATALRMLVQLLQGTPGTERKRRSQR
jgi:nicotinamide-nucleotide amidase